MPEVKIDITAQDKTGNVISDVNNKMGGLNSSIQAGKMVWTELSSAIGLAKQAYQVVGEVINQTVGVTVAYAAQVETLARATGASAEESSRLIQLTDDLRVEYGTLRLAMRAATQQGINLTTEELARMSDVYLQLAPGVERNQYLIQSFGRAGLEMAKILEVGSKAIREMSAGVEDALVLNEEAIQQAKEYTMAEDALNDAFMAVKVTVGAGLLPILTDLANWSVEFNKINSKHQDDLQKYPLLIGQILVSWQAWSNVLGKNTNELDDATTSAQRNYEAMAQQAEAQRLLREQTDLATGAWQANEIALAQVKDAEDAVKLSNELLQQTYDPLAAALRGLTSEIIFQTVAQNLDADSALKLARDMGLVTDTQLMQTQKLKQLNDEYRAGRLTTDEYTTAVLNLNDAIQALEDKTVTVTVEQNWFQNQTQENPYTEVGWGTGVLPGATTGHGTAEDPNPGAPSVSIGTVVLAGGMDYQSLVYRLKRDLGRR